jgi:hypothetical protein
MIGRTGKTKADATPYLDRLQITADVDAAGLAKLKQVLDQYEAILKLLR